MATTISLRKRPEWQDELDTLRRKHKGILRPRDVVNFARNPSTALHSRFTWDDSTAAESYRLWEARMLIRVWVEVLPGTNARPNRVFVSLMADRTSTGGGYRTMESVLADPERRAALLDEALQEMEIFRQKYKGLKELARVFDAMQDVENDTMAHAARRQ